MWRGKRGLVVRPGLPSVLIGSLFTCPWLFPLAQGLISTLKLISRNLLLTAYSYYHLIPFTIYSSYNYRFIHPGLFNHFSPFTQGLITSACCCCQYSNHCVTLYLVTAFYTSGQWPCFCPTGLSLDTHHDNAVARTAAWLSARPGVVFYVY